MARPCDLAWIRSTVEQCREAGIPAFVKQVGAKPCDGRWYCHECFALVSDEQEGPRTCFLCGSSRVRRIVPMVDRKGGDITEFPEDLRVREFPR
jgi:hypothetical protein